VYDQYQDGKKTNPWGPGVKGLAIYDANGWCSWEMMSANRSRSASDNPRNPVGQAIAHFGTYAVDEAAKTLTYHIERCTFPQWDEHDGTVNIEFPTEDDLNITLTKAIPAPSGAPSSPTCFSSE